MKKYRIGWGGVAFLFEVKIKKLKNMFYKHTDIYIYTDKWVIYHLIILVPEQRIILDTKNINITHTNIWEENITNYTEHAPPWEAVVG